MPKVAAAEVQEGLPYAFNQHHFTAAWKRLKARPQTGARNPEHTNPDWCEFDEPTGSYRYTRAFVKHLIKKCSTPEGFLEITGMDCKPKPASGASRAGQALAEPEDIASN